VKKALIVRNGTSGRFSPIAAILGETGWTGAVINGPVGTDIEGWINMRWSAKAPADPGMPRAVRKFRDAMLCAQAAAGAAQRLRNDGFVPDVIIGHPGWGEMMLLSEVFPGVPQVHCGEYYYQTHGADVNFDPEFPTRSIEGGTMIKAQNAVLAASYAEAAAIVAPTPFQADRLPTDFRAKVEVIHEGIDTGLARRRTNGPHIAVPGGLVLDGSVPVISFVNRRFEPIRGFHVFMRMLPRLLALVPDLHVVLVGADDPANTYGARPGPTGCWREVMLAEVAGKLDSERVHFLRPMAYEHLLALFSNVRAHVYLTYPFVLSWSLLDAMACETLLVASDTAPVRDVIEHGGNGLLVDFFDGEAMADTLAEVCRSPAKFEPLRTAARETVITRFDRHGVCMPAWRRLVERVAVGG
jgi:glycosyltransferase involved in cell wall biosynthesis